MQTEGISMRLPPDSLLANARFGAIALGQQEDI